MGRRRALASLSLLVLAACADRPASGPQGPDPEQRYEATGTVLEGGGHGPELCLGGIADSLPPQCSGLELVGWDWSGVEGEESASGTTWGSFDVVGTYDGTAFTVLEVVGPATYDRGTGDPVDTPCPEPVGGWTSADVSPATEDDLTTAVQAAEAEPDSAGGWIDYVEEVTNDLVPVPPGGIILTAAFTGDIERHTGAIRELWGGPLCVVQHDRTQRELMRIQSELGGEAGQELGLETTWSATDIVSNTVQLGVVVADQAARAAVDERYGEGAVLLVPALVPVADTA
jgi:hypothetical protein